MQNTQERLARLQEQQQRVEQRVVAAQRQSSLAAQHEREVGLARAQARAQDARHARGQVLRPEAQDGRALRRRPRRQRAQVQRRAAGARLLALVQQKLPLGRLCSRRLIRRLCMTAWPGATCCGGMHNLM